MTQPWSRYTHLDPAEREDEDRWWEHEFGVTQLKEEDERGEWHLKTDQGQPEGWDYA